ncbi:hypothetical protein AAFN85_01130 [Mucilaginibacter sp. CAU 1740]|uniref:hypothetical protein n=1 Tax=Mucilaginibacter sp. CAU 1740 TaxID=3140365 RepID=UPI00325A5AEA
MESMIEFLIPSPEVQIWYLPLVYIKPVVRYEFGADQIIQYRQLYILRIVKYDAIEVFVVTGIAV